MREPQIVMSEGALIWMVSMPAVLAIIHAISLHVLLKGGDFLGFKRNDAHVRDGRPTERAETKV